MGVLHLRYVETLTREQRKLLAIIVMLSALTTFEYFHGFLSADVKEVADSVQSTWHIAVLILSFFSIHLSLQPKDVAFAYGYERVETLAAFTNCCLIIFECTFGFIHGLLDLLVSTLGGSTHGHSHAHRGNSQQHLGSMVVCCASVNLFGLMLFSQELRLMLHRCLLTRSATMPAHSENMVTVAIKLLGSVLGALTLVAKFWAARSKEGIWALLEAPLYLVTNVFLVYLALPVLFSTGRILLLAIPLEVQTQLNRCFEEVSHMDGVLEVCQWNFWPVASSRSLVGVVSLRVRPDGIGTTLADSVKSVCSCVCADLTLQML